MQRDFEELPASAVPSLRESLIGLLLQHGAGTGPVRTQLCLAIAALAAHVPAREWSSQGLLPWLLERLSAAPAAVALPSMLQLLLILPQEAGSYRPSIRPERRREMFDELKASFPTALQILSNCLSEPGAFPGCITLNRMAEFLIVCLSVHSAGMTAIIDVSVSSSSPLDL